MKNEASWQKILADIRRILPLQNPLREFLHNNLLMAWEDKEFAIGVQEAARFYGANLPSEDRLQKPKTVMLSESKIEWLCLMLESFFDQGVGRFQNPYAQLGLLEFFKDYYKKTWLTAHPWQETLRTRLLKDCPDAHIGILSFWEKFDEKLQIDSETWKSYCLYLLFSVKGWSGMVNKAETDPSKFPTIAPKAKLEDFIYIMLCMNEDKEEALQRIKRETLSLKSDNFPSLQMKIEEHQLYKKFLDKVASHKSEISSDNKFFVFCCMDDRLESFRRHVEKEEPNCRTFGVLGNFNLATRFVGIHHPRSKQQCPPVVTPTHYLVEKEVDPSPSKKTIHFFRDLHLKVFYASRISWISAPLSIAMGLISFFHIFIKMFLPEFAMRLRNASLTRLFQKSCKTSIPVKDSDYNQTQDQKLGYTSDEIAALVYSVIGPLGIKDWADCVLVMGHESTSVNNPFFQAYGCGACSGNSGLPNARAFAAMANDPKIRSLVSKRLVATIPEHVVFIPSVFDTTRDRVRYFPEDTQAFFSRLDISKHITTIRTVLDKALAQNALERSVWFGNQRKARNPNHALKLVDFRSENPSEVRPEYGHSRTFLAIFGRRQLTHDFNLDRRSLLLCYDESADPDHSHLTSLVHGAMPVVGNITLDYYFSAIDPHGFGAGSKLPLNIASLIGVISGSRGDLRVGLPAQMVEIHTPARPLVLIEANELAVDKIIQQHARLQRLVTNEWMRVATINPVNRAIKIKTRTGWENVETALEYA